VFPTAEIMGDIVVGERTIIGVRAGSVVKQRIR
jgi:serine acetyltransferase